MAPFDVEEFRAITYKIDSGGKVVDANSCIDKIAARLVDSRSKRDSYDNPVAELIHSVNKTFEFLG